VVTGGTVTGSANSVNVRGDGMQYHLPFRRNGKLVHFAVEFSSASGRCEPGVSRPMPFHRTQESLGYSPAGSHRPLADGMAKEGRMSRRNVTLFAAVPIATFIAYVLARAMLSEAWQKFIYAENGPIELGTAALFAVASGSALTLCRKGNHIPGVYRGLFLLFAGLCTFIALEEISYGQQLFGWASPTWFEENNHHHQTNLHNLMGNRPSHVLKNVGNYGTLLGFIVLPAVTMRFQRAYRTGHWTHYLLPRMELMVVTGMAQVCSFLWDSPRSMLGDYWHQGWNEVRELYWGMAAVGYVIVIRGRLLARASIEPDLDRTERSTSLRNAA
jgi:hypothetical protein